MAVAVLASVGVYIDLQTLAWAAIRPTCGQQPRRAQARLLLNAAVRRSDVAGVLLMPHVNDFILPMSDCLFEGFQADRGDQPWRRSGTSARMPFIGFTSALCIDGEGWFSRSMKKVVLLPRRRLIALP